jgi:hypothetical protein
VGVSSSNSLGTTVSLLKHRSLGIVLRIKRPEGRAWWHSPVIPATWEAEVRGLQSEAGPGESKRLYLKNKVELKAQGLGHGSTGRA